MSTDALKRNKRSKQKHIKDLCDTITKLSESVSEESSNQDIELELTELLKMFDSYVLELNSVQGELERLVSESEFDSVVDNFVQYTRKIQSSRLEALKLLKKIQTVRNKVEQAETVSVSNVSNSCLNARLPKISLPHFGGEVKNWLPFWDQFKVLIHETELPAVTKFTYLTSVLKNEARSSISNLALTDANYTTAINILQERYGRKEAIIACHIDSLLNVKFHVIYHPVSFGIFWTE